MFDWIRRLRRRALDGPDNYSPDQTWKWRRNEKRPPVNLAVTPEWTLTCPRNAVTFSFWYQLHDEPQILELQEFIQLSKGLPAVSLLDIGCHFGLLTFAAIHAGGRKTHVTAVDASGLALQMVERIAALNGVQEQIQCVHSAVGARRGELEMVPGGRSAAGYFLEARGSPSARSKTKIPLTTLDDLASTMPHPPTVIKIDVEGFEQEVLKGGPRTLSEKSIPVCLEMHNKMLRDRGTDPAAVLKTLDGFGYRHFSSGGRTLASQTILDADLIRLIARKEGRY